ncbi:M56 family metallopeptidase [Paenibacillus sp. ACRSA]|uniref:M56 family metallopeptidase n=1 Tax=Paenibacillus sp. ACRSA TaxID=2918211 RepID=UPI001EF46724|nr:M56 family metallopeptidase [Paenibacillus sp. ACRSA]MCG7378441.1 M56 family metallopeptidase [Paenibacillus sp. ACRSA]
MWRARSKLLFTVGIGIPLFVFMQMFMYAMYKIFGWDIPFNLLWLCNHWMSRLGWVSVGHVLLVLVCLTFAGTGWLLLDRMMQTRAAIQKLRTLENVALSREFEATYQHLKRPGFIIVDKRSPVAFTIGLWRPYVVLSTGLLSMLDAEEETAVVYHEVHHLWHRDPLKTMLLSVFAIMMPYLPVLKHTSKHYHVVREILADNEAIERTGNAAGIGSALLKLIRAYPEQWHAKGMAAQSSFADTSVNVRISRLLDPEQDVRLILPRYAVLTSATVILLLSVLFVWSIG